MTNRKSTKGVGTVIKGKSTQSRTALAQDMSEKNLMERINSLPPEAREHFNNRIKDVNMIIEEQNKQAEESKDALIRAIKTKAAALKAMMPDALRKMTLGELEARGGRVMLSEKSRMVAGRLSCRDIEIHVPKAALKSLQAAHVGHLQEKTPIKPARSIRPGEKVIISLVSETGTPIHIEPEVKNEIEEKIVSRIVS